MSLELLFKSVAPQAKPLLGWSEVKNKIHIPAVFSQIFLTYLVGDPTLELSGIWELPELAGVVKRPFGKFLKKD